MMTDQKEKHVKKGREGWCPVYDLACPSGLEAAEACEHRFAGDYNPLTTFRDADITHCALYRQEQLEANEQKNSPSTEEGTAE